MRGEGSRVRRCDGRGGGRRCSCAASQASNQEYNGDAFDDNQFSAAPGSLEEEILAMTNYDDDAADSRKSLQRSSRMVLIHQI